MSVFSSKVNSISVDSREQEHKTERVVFLRKTVLHKKETLTELHKKVGRLLTWEPSELFKEKEVRKAAPVSLIEPRRELCFRENCFVIL